MELRDKVVVVTGGGSGIGKALCARFAAEGARAVVAADVDGDAAHATADEIGAAATGVAVDVANEAGVVGLVERTEDVHGPIDLYCSNAGIAVGGGVEASDEAWYRIWDVNLMAHVWAARALVPRMRARGEGYLLNTASAAGLLTNLGAAPYAVTKHAAVALAEWMSITYAADGIKVSCLCPQGVRTPMLLGGLQAGDTGGSAVLASGGMLEPEDVAEAVVQGLRAEQFLILPHPEVRDYMQRKATDNERWLSGMRRLQERVAAARR